MTAKLFRIGPDQTVRVLREFELARTDAIILKEGERVVIEAAPPRLLRPVLATSEKLDEKFPELNELETGSSNNESL